MIVSEATTLIWSVSILLVVFSFILFFGTKKLSTKTFSLSVLLTGIWVFTVSIDGLPQSVGIFYDRVCYFLGVSIALSLVFFIHTYPEEKVSRIKTWVVIIAFHLLQAYLYLFTPYVIADSQGTSWFLGEGAAIFYITFFGYITIALTILIKKIQMNTGRIRLELMYIFSVILIGLLPSIIFSIMLPLYRIFDYNWIGPISQFFWIPVISYSIIRHGQLNVKILLAQALAIGMSVIFISNVLFDITPSPIARFINVLLFIILAYLLIKTSINEQLQKNLLQKVNINLEGRIKTQTSEIERAYELEREARRSLEKLNESKDQFIIITQHHLRTPSISIKNELDFLASNGIYKSIYKSNFERIRFSAEKVLRMLNDFLSITSIRRGSPILNIETYNIGLLVDSVIDELKIELNNRNISVEIYPFTKFWPELEIDSAKIREALYVIIENAIRYNEQNGRIIINMSTNNNLATLTIFNSGLTVSNEDIEQIRLGHFYRSEAAKNKFPNGMGIGLSVTTSIISCHKGDLNIEPNKESGGTIVTLQLPVKQHYEVDAEPVK